MVISWSIQGRGTPSFGKRHQKTHTLCRRCGRMSYHKQTHTCASCGYPAAKLRKCNNDLILDGWSLKVQQRKGTGTGRMRYLKTIPRVFKNQIKGLAKWMWCSYLLFHYHQLRSHLPHLSSFTSQIIVVVWGNIFKIRYTVITNYRHLPMEVSLHLLKLLTAFLERTGYRAYTSTTYGSSW